MKRSAVSTSVKTTRCELRQNVFSLCMPFVNSVQLGENEKRLIDKLEFSQVVNFVKSMARCKGLCRLLQEQNFLAVEIHQEMSLEYWSVPRTVRKSIPIDFLAQIAWIQRIQRIPHSDSRGYKSLCRETFGDSECDATSEKESMFVSRVYENLFF